MSGCQEWTLGPLGRVARALATESSFQSLVFLLTRSHGGQAGLQLSVAKDDLELRASTYPSEDDRQKVLHCPGLCLWSMGPSLALLSAGMTGLCLRALLLWWFPRGRPQIPHQLAMRLLKPPGSAWDQ